MSNHLPDGKDLCDLASPNTFSLSQMLLEQEKRIKEVRTLLVDLENEHRALKEEVNYTNDRLLLPPEITAEIFKFCIPEDIMDLDIQDISPRYMICAPLVLSAVCRRWRNIAHSTPELWNIITVRLRSSDSGFSNHLTLVREWIERSRQLPLSISLCVTGSTAEIEIVAVHMIKIFNKHAVRWLNLKYEGALELASHFSGNDLPLFNTLHLKNTGYYNGRYEIGLYSTQLQVLSMNGEVLSALQLEWSRIREVVVQLATLSECVEVVRRAPLLTKCTFGPLRKKTALGHLHAFILPLDPVVHPGIQYLELSLLLFIGIPSHLVFPCLKTLVLDFAGEYSIVLPIFHFLEISGCSLESLSLIHVDLSALDITLLGDGIPTLRHLSLRLSTLEALRTVLVCLAEFSIVNGEKRPQHLPHLRSLSLAHDVFHEWEMLPDIFATSISDTTHPIEWHRPALQSFGMFVFPQATRHDSELVYKIGEETLMKILRLREAGVEWKIQFGQERNDMLWLAVERYGIPFKY